MADRHENIVARFIAANTQRFKREVHGAARAVRDVGYEGSHASEELEVLKLISARLARQHETLIVIENRLAAQIDEVGDQARQTGRSLGFLGFMSNRAKGRRDSGMLGLLGVNSRLKDKLSLTASEVKSVALTMGAYLSPALIELGASFGAAVTGAGIVGGAGLTSLLVGLGGLGLVGKTAAGQIQKVTQAQAAYNLAVAQYGAGSKEAAAASGRLLAVITANGGVPVWNAVRATNALKKAWTDRTGPARASLFDIISGGVGAGQRLLPTFARQTNLNAANVRHSLTGAFSQLGGPEMRRNIVVFSRTFRSMFGPLTRGGVNLLFALLRLFRVAAPYAVLFANSFERWTASLRRGSKDTGRLARFVSDMVDNTKSWWGLLKALGRTLRIVFGGSVDDGRSLADSMTNVVDRFNRWLLVIDGSGRTRIKRFFDNFNSTLRLLFSDPQEFARRAAVFFIQVARAGFWKFVQTWWSLDLSSKLFVLAFLFRGAIFATMGRLAGTLFLSAFLPRMTAAFAAEGLVGSAFARFGAISGAAWGRAFLAGALTFGLYALYKHLQKHPFNPGGIFSGLHTSNKPSGLTVNNAAKLGPKMPESRTHWLRDHPKRAGGGNIPWGTSAIVGEAGPELMAASASGPRITPMGFAPPGASGLRSMESILSVSDMLPPVQINLIADGRKLATVVHNFNESTRSRRGGRPLGAT